MMQLQSGNSSRNEEQELPNSLPLKIEDEDSPEKGSAPVVVSEVVAGGAEPGQNCMLSTTPVEAVTLVRQHGTVAIPLMVKLPIIN